MSESGTVKILDQPKVKRKATRLVLEGKTNAEIARRVNVHPATVHRWKTREDIKEWIDSQAQRYIESLPEALAVSKNILDIGKHQTENAITRDESGEIVKVDSGKIDHRLVEAALKESEKVRQAVGITPSQSTSVVIGQMILGDQNNVLLDNVKNIIDRQLVDILDVTDQRELGE